MPCNQINFSDQYIRLTRSIDPSDTMNPTDPSDTINPTDPSDTINPTDPSDTMNPTDPSDTMNQTNSTGSIINTSCNGEYHMCTESQVCSTSKILYTIWKFISH